MTSSTSPKYLLPTPDDNAGIVTRRLEAGEQVDIDGQSIELQWPILQGHRLCIRPIARGESLLSWGLPFGTATVDINPGDYLCNATAKEVLQIRHPNDYDDRLAVNFEDRDTVAERILPDNPVFGRNRPDIDDGLTFQGFHRGPQRGWGTRNYLVVIGATSRVRQTVLQVVSELQQRWPAEDGFDGVVPIVHTEGGGQEAPNNRAVLLSALAGMATNPNAGATLIVNDEAGWLRQDEILGAIERLALDDAPPVHCHDSGNAHFAEHVLRDGNRLIPDLILQSRTPAPLSGLRLGLQCGGSDAFSGVTANQVLGQAVHRLIRRGGSANLAETDELIGAEQHVLARVADRDTFDRFLAVQQRFKEYAAAHGHTAEGNVSGGNLYRGLYNITLKSIGAARKKDPQTCIDHVIDYATLMRQPGYYFMDSPGNDLESIAGQIAAGANLVLFTTGNGSITNFPFVPTLKIVTTDERFRLLASDMDFDAGRVLQGETLDAAGERLFHLLVETASGTRAKGEYTGQYQTQIWRNAYFPSRGELIAVERAGPPRFNAEPLIAAAPDDRQAQIACRATPGVALVLPTSLCSGQVAELIANDMTRGVNDTAVVALAHTEGCGVSGGDSETLFRDTLIGYATHPLVERCVFLEHGCEKTHNDYFRAALKAQGIDAARFDWASIQLEGGIHSVSQHVATALQSPRDIPSANASPLLIGLATQCPLGGDTARLLAATVIALLGEGIGVVMVANDPLLSQETFTAALALDATPATLGYSQRPNRAGFHVMDCSASDWLEIATGLGASGCRCLIAVSPHRPVQPHRFIPTLQFTDAPGRSDFDTDPERHVVAGDDSLAARVRDTLAGHYVPRNRPMANVGFQISRGRYGVSL